MRKTLHLGVFGFGVVAQGLYHVINETKGIKAEIKKIVVKNKTKQRAIPMEYFSFDKESILQDPEIDVVVELIDDSEAAFELLRESLRHGKAFVTANKKMIAEHLDEVYELQRKYGKPVLDRVLTPDTPLNEAAKCALVSMDSTLKSNLSVGLPLDMVVYQADHYRSDQVLCIDDNNAYFHMLRTSWGEKLRQAFDDLADPMWNNEPTEVPLITPGAKSRALKKIRSSSDKLI